MNSLPAESRRVARGFDALAPFYDAAGTLALGGRLAHSQRALLPFVKPGLRVLVVGGGAGKFLVDLLRRCDPRSVVYLDVSKGMTARARRRVAREVPGAASRVHFCRGGLSALRPEARFDLVCTHCFLDLFDDSGLDRALAQLDATLLPGGHWLFSDFARARGSRVGRAGSAAVTWMLYRAFRLVCGIEAHRLPRFAVGFRRRGYFTECGGRWLGGLLEAKLYQKPERR